MNDALYAYLHRVSLRESDVQRRLREETAALEYSGMQISPEQGQLMRMLAGSSARGARLKWASSPATARFASLSRCRKTAS